MHVMCIVCSIYNACIYTKTNSLSVCACAHGCVWHKMCAHAHKQTVQLMDYDCMQTDCLCVGVSNCPLFLPVYGYMYTCYPISLSTDDDTL